MQVNHSQLVWGSIPGWNRTSLPVSLSKSSRFLPQSKDVHIMLIGFTEIA